MIDAAICDGDYVVIRQEQTAEQRRDRGRADRRRGDGQDLPAQGRQGLAAAPQRRRTSRSTAPTPRSSARSPRSCAASDGIGPRRRTFRPSPPTGYGQRVAPAGHVRPCSRDRPLPTSNRRRHVSAPLSRRSGGHAGRARRRSSARRSRRPVRGRLPTASDRKALHRDALQARQPAALDRAADRARRQGRRRHDGARNLCLQRDSLSAADRAAYDKLAGRPSKPAVDRRGNIRIHYDPAEMAHAFSATDVLNTSVTSPQSYSGSGYRQPKSDQGPAAATPPTSTRHARAVGLYGYCTTDQPTLRAGPLRRVGLLRRSTTTTPASRPTPRWRTSR